MDLRTMDKTFRKRFRQLEERQLSLAYDQLSIALNEIYDVEAKQTLFEEIFKKMWISTTNVAIYQSIWIGKRNIDFFIPGITSCKDLGFRSKMKGLVIEIDGKIHESYQKMKKDESKFDSLQGLGIGSIVFENRSFDNPVVLKVLDNIPKFYNDDYRLRKRLWRNIAYVTLRAHKQLIIKENITIAKSVLKILGEA